MNIPTRMLLFLAGTWMLANAQTNTPDEIVLANGDKLTGHFVRATGSTVTFKSDVLGDLTIDWSKVKELHTSVNVAVIRKGVKLRKHENVSGVPQGTLTVENQNLQLPPPTQPIPVSNAEVVIDQPDFQKAMTQ